MVLAVPLADLELGNLAGGRGDRERDRPGGSSRSRGRGGSGRTAPARSRRGRRPAGVNVSSRFGAVGKCQVVIPCSSRERITWDRFFGGFLTAIRIFSGRVAGASPPRRIPRVAGATSVGESIRIVVFVRIDCRPIARWNASGTGAARSRAPRLGAAPPPLSTTTSPARPGAEIRIPSTSTGASPVSDRPAIVSSRPPLGGRSHSGWCGPAPATTGRSTGSRPSACSGRSRASDTSPRCRHTRPCRTGTRRPDPWRP